MTFPVCPEHFHIYDHAGRLVAIGTVEMKEDFKKAIESGLFVTLDTDPAADAKNPSAILTAPAKTPSLNIVK